MQLTQFTDYSLRVLLYAGLKMKRATVKEIAQNFNISQNHLIKVVHRLGQLGWIKNVKGAGGGLELAPKALALTVADVVLEIEGPIHLLECFDAHTNTCPIIGVCKLQQAMVRARKAFIEELARVHIKDLLKSHRGDPRLARLGLTGEGAPGLTSR